MATLAQIFGYELAIESAWQSVLESAFNAALPGVNVYIQATDLDKITPYVDVQLRHAVATGQQANTSLGLFWSAWNSLLVSRVVTTRGKNSDQHSTIIAKVREKSALFQTVLDRDVLPYHSVREMQDHDSPRGAIPHELIDFTEVTYLCQFNIWPDAWP